MLAPERQDGAVAVREARIEEGGRECHTEARGVAHQEGLPHRKGEEGTPELQVGTRKHGGSLRPHLHLQHQHQQGQGQKLPNQEDQELMPTPPQQQVHHH